MRPVVAWFLAVLTSVAALGAWWVSRTPQQELEQKLIPTKVREAAAMAPWRDPKGDIARFFPREHRWTQQTIPLSSVRQKILVRLGPDATLDSNVLYVYRVGKAGSVLVRRFSGDYGAVEVVIAVSPEHKIIGLHIQRHREPPEQAKRLEDTAGFKDKGPNDPLRQTSPSLARAVHAELVALDVADSP